MTESEERRLSWGVGVGQRSVNAEASGESSEARLSRVAACRSPSMLVISSELGICSSITSTESVSCYWERFWYVS